MYNITACGVCVVVACSTSVSDPAGARRLGNASIGLSVAGIVVSVIVIIVVVAVAATGGFVSSCAYTVYGTCYGNRRYVGYYSTCYSYELKSGRYCYY